MTRTGLGRFWKITAFLVAACIIIASFTYWKINRALEALPIADVQLDLQSINRSGLVIRQLSFRPLFLPTPATVTLNKINVEWQLSGLKIPTIKTVVVENLDIQLEKSASNQTTAAWNGIVTLPHTWPAGNDWPQDIQIQSWQLRTRCAKEVCTLSGTLSFTEQGGEKELTLIASPETAVSDEHFIQLKARYALRDSLPSVTVSAQLDKKPLIELKNHLHQQDEKTLLWQGEAQAELNYLPPWWIENLAHWGITFDQEKRGTLQDRLTAQATWKTELIKQDATSGGQPFLLASLPVNIKWQLSNVDITRPVLLALLPPLPLLSFTQGSIDSSGEAVWEVLRHQMLHTQTQLKLNKISGIYDTTEYVALSGNVDVKTDKDALVASIAPLKIDAIKQGVAIENLAATAIYRAPLTQPGKGTLTLEKVNGQLLGGEIALNKSTFVVGRARNDMTVSLTRINLETLFAQYPGTDISGNGYVSGMLPLQLSERGVKIVGGKLEAENGGAIRYRSPRAAALAASAPGMDIMVKALDDFHYSLLNSSVDYSESGQLLLGVTLQGKNPQMKESRPVHLNINLEENIPTLLASLQLSGQISAMIQKRIQEKQSTKTAR